MSLISELQRRNVIRVAVGYLAGAWLLIQILETLFPIFGLPETAVRGLVIALAIGFVPALVLAWVFEWTPDGFKRESDVSDETARGSTQGFDRAITVILILALGYFAVDKFMLDPARDAEQIAEAVEEARTEAVLGQYEGRSILVLPFVNMSSDPEQEYFSDGMTEEMLNLLAQMPELRVISRSTAFTYKGKEVDIREAAERLDVSHVLEGSVRKSGNKIRITAQLIEATTDTHLWSDTYDRELQDVFAIQDEISTHVVDELKLRLLAEAPTAAVIDPVAYENYLRARHLIQGVGTTEAMQAAIPLLDRTLAVAPDFVPALFYKAVLVEVISDLDFTTRRQRLRTIIDRMVDLDPLSSYTNAWRAWLALMHEGDVGAAARYVELGVADDLFNPQPLMGRLADVYSRLGRHEEALAIADIRVDRDPACVFCVSGFVNTARWAGHYRLAAERAEEVLDWYQPNQSLWWSIGAAWLGAGEPARAIEYFDKMIERGWAAGDFGRVLALYDVGRTEEFEVEFSAMRESEASSEAIARVYAWMGNSAKAVAELERVEAELGRAAVLSSLSSDHYARIASDPDFIAFKQRYVLPTEGLSGIEFDPPLPDAIRAEMELRLARQDLLGD